MKNTMKDSILLMAAHNVQMKMINFGLNLRNPFSATMALICRTIAEFKLNMTEANKIEVGFALIPRKSSFLKKLSSPPVVAVSVVAIISRMICNGI